MVPEGCAVVLLGASKLSCLSAHTQPVGRGMPVFCCWISHCPVGDKCPIRRAARTANTHPKLEKTTKKAELCPPPPHTHPSQTPQATVPGCTAVGMRIPREGPTPLPCQSPSEMWSCPRELPGQDPTLNFSQAATGLKPWLSNKNNRPELDFSLVLYGAAFLLLLVVPGGCLVWGSTVSACRRDTRTCRGPVG